MEYVFGTIHDSECVKTVGSKHSDLSGFCHVERHYTDNNITDDFKVVKKIKSVEEDGVFYDWYLIEDHRRIEDKFTPAKAEIEGGIAENSDAIFDVAELSDENSNCIEEIAEMTSDLEERLAVLEGGNK